MLKYSIVFFYFQVWNVKQSNELREEIEIMKKGLLEIKIEFGEGLFKELKDFKEFENEVGKLIFYQIILNHRLMHLKMVCV